MVFGYVMGMFAVLLVVLAPPPTLAPLAYRHPGLTVDLGVGLWAWPIPWDVDRDGRPDLLVACPDKPSNGVWKFINTGRLDAQGREIFSKGERIGAARHYLMPSIVQNRLHVLGPGQLFEDFETAAISKPRPLPLAANFYKPDGPQPKGPKVRHNQWRLVDYDGDGITDLVTGIEDWSHYGWDDGYDATGRWTHGPLHGYVFLHRNLGTDEAPKYASPVKLTAGGKPIDTLGCPTPNFADFDGDGDLDLVCGEFLDGLTYYRNVGTRTKPTYEPGVRIRDDRGTPITMFVQMIVPHAFDWNGDGRPDLIVGDEDGRVAKMMQTGRFHGDGSPIFERPVWFQQEADTLKAGALATPAAVDWDGDGDFDLLVGNTAGTIEFFENLSGPNVAAPKWAAPRSLTVDGKPFRIMAGPNGSIQGPAEAKWGYSCFSVADWDHDGLPDIVLNSILGEVVWLRNTGPRKAPTLAAPVPLRVDWVGPPPTLAWGWRKPKGDELLTQWRTTPVAYDFTGDGRADLAVLDTEGYVTLFERGDGPRLKHPRRAFADEAGRPLRLSTRTAGGSGRRKWCIADWDGDGKFDLLVNSINADLYRGLGKIDGVWRFASPVPLTTRNIEGHDVGPAVVDFDGDGIPDFLGGAEDGRLYFLRNPRSK